MYGRDFVTDAAEGRLFTQVLFEFIEKRAASSPDEAFVIMHCEPERGRERRSALFASPEALGEFERAWRGALRRRREVRTLAA